MGALIAAVVTAPVAAAQSEGVPESIAADGVPPIPEALVSAARRYNEFRNAVLLGWHPTRRAVLILTRFADTYQVHQVDTPGGARRQLTFFRDHVLFASSPSLSASYAPRDTSTILVSTYSRGTEANQTYRLDVTTGSTRLLTDGTSINSPGRWSSAGTRLAYTSSRRTGKDFDLWVMSPNDSGGHMLAQLSGGGWSVRGWSPDDRTILLSELVSAADVRLWTVDVESGARRRVSPVDSVPAAYENAVIAPDGRSVYLTTNRGSDRQRLARLDLVSGSLTFLLPNLRWEIDEIALAPDGRRLALLTNEAGRSGLQVYDLQLRQARSLTIPTGVASWLKWRPDSRELGFTLSSVRAPYDVYSIDPGSGRLAQWTASETGGINTAALPEPEIVRWRASDGVELSGFLYRPPSRFRGPRPVMIFVHGGPEDQYRPEFLGAANFYTNELGVALVYPNIRGSTGFGAAFERLDNGLARESAYGDIGALLDWIARDRRLDSSRVVIAGESYGGNVALVAAARYGRRLRGAIDHFGISDFVSFLERTPEVRRDLRRVEYGDERNPEVRAFLKRISPLAAGGITVPLLVTQGANDARVPASESEQIVKSVRAAGGTAWYVLAKDEGHGFARQPNTEYVLYATALFLKTYLLGP